ncbi:hypothetical protein KSC_104220 [Ktedonobacter sp. SOSP1-52]|nr:hypothetical protein KSC_104220 [Ktedonobacter sp. SOSP1-52]
MTDTLRQAHTTGSNHTTIGRYHRHPSPPLSSTPLRTLLLLLPFHTRPFPTTDALSHSRLLRNPQKN